jgi:hypothetical protein
MRLDFSIIELFLTEKKFLGGSLVLQLDSYSGSLIHTVALDGVPGAAAALGW